jgi:hypothetical protein
MNAKSAQRPRQVDLVAQATTSELKTQNPLANITLILPETIDVRLVNASALNEYEIWFGITGMLSSATVGFFVAFVQTPPERGNSTAAFFWAAIMFGVLFMITGIAAIYKRWQLTQKTKRVRLTVGSPVDEGGGFGI